MVDSQPDNQIRYRYIYIYIYIFKGVTPPLLANYHYLNLLNNGINGVIMLKCINFSIYAEKAAQG